MDEAVVSVARRERAKKVLQYPSKKKSKYIHNWNQSEQGQCRCCHAEGNFRRMEMKQQYSNGNFMSYNEMLRVAFNISLAQIRINGKEKSKLICPTCEVRLRDAYNFCLHVRESEETFLMALPPGAKLTVESKSIDDSEKRDLSVDTELVVLDDEFVDVNAQSGVVNLKSDGVNAEYVGVKAEAVDVTAQGVIKVGPNDVNIISVYVNSEPMKTKEAASEKDTMNAFFEIEKVEHGIDHLYELFSDCDKKNNPGMPMDISKELDIPKVLEIKTEPEYQDDFADITVTDTLVAVKTEVENELTFDKEISVTEPSFAEEVATTEMDLDTAEATETKPDLPEDFTTTINLEEDKMKIIINKEKKEKVIKIVNEVDKPTAARTIFQKSEFRPDLIGEIVKIDTAKKDVNVENVEVIFKETGHSLKCSFCAVVLDCNFQDISEHMLRAHGLPAIMRKSEPTVKPTTAPKRSSKSTYSCKICSFGFEDLEEFQAHKKIHPFTCLKCFNTFSSNVSLKKHMASGHRYKCQMCGDSFNDYELLQQHKVQIHGAEYPCGCCEKNFYRRAELMKHERAKHVRTEYPCPHCDYKVPSRSELYKHISAKHKNLEEIEISCRLCEKKFMSKATLKQHFSTAHPVEPFE